MELWTALVVGFVGSFHCVGMCGPLVMAIPRSSNRPVSVVSNALVYNAGRIFTYSVFGVVFGFVGRGITLSGLQSKLSVLLGVLIIAAVFFSGTIRRLRKPAAYNSLVQRITAGYGKLLRKNSVPALAGMGLLNGLLPCAFVYAGLSAAVLTETPLHSAAYMALFGLGTLPAMFAMYLAPGFISLNLRASIRKYQPYLAVILGVLLIIRGLALQDLGLTGGLRDQLDFFCIFPGTHS